MTFLAWGMIDSKEGYVKSGQWENAVDCLRWGMDYLIKVLQLLTETRRVAFIT